MSLRGLDELGSVWMDAAGEMCSIFRSLLIAPCASRKYIIRQHMPYFKKVINYKRTKEDEQFIRGLYEAALLRGRKK